MRPTAPALLAVLALGLAAVGLAACGDSAKLIPPNQATRMDDQLQQATDKMIAGDCEAATAALGSAQATFATLPATVDARLRSRIQDGLRSLATTLPKDCAAIAAGGTTDTTTTDTTATTDTTTTTTPTTTTPTTTTTTPPPTTTTPTTTTPPTTTAPPVGGVTPEGGTTTGGTP